MDFTATKIYLHNKSTIIKNWRDNEFIRESFEFSLIKYAQKTAIHYMTECFLVNDNQNGFIEKDLYRSLQ